MGLAAWLEPLLGAPGPDDQGVLCLAIVRLLDGALVDVQGEEVANPFLTAPQAAIEAGAHYGPVLVAELRALARRLADAGLALDPDDHGVLLVLAQLALLEIDLDHLDAALVDDLNLLPPGSFERAAIDRGWTELTASRHATSRMRADLDAIAAQLAARRSGLRHIDAPYARGGRRAAPPETRRLRDALTELVAGDRSLTPRVLLDPAGGEDHPALVKLRAALGWPADFVPEQRTLERNWPTARH